MKIADVFAHIYDNETPNDQLKTRKQIKDRERKYQIIRTILVEKLADKNDFSHVIINHDDIVERVAELTGEDKVAIDAALIEIYNYPEIIAEYTDIIDEDLKFGDDDGEDQDDDEEDEDDEDDDDDDESSDIHVVDVNMNSDTMNIFNSLNRKMTLITLFSFVTMSLGIYETVRVHIGS
jgi:hypothetical protein